MRNVSGWWCTLFRPFAGHFSVLWPRKTQSKSVRGGSPWHLAVHGHRTGTSTGRTRAGNESNALHAVIGAAATFSLWPQPPNPLGGHGEHGEIDVIPPHTRAFLRPTIYQPPVDGRDGGGRRGLTCVICGMLHFLLFSAQPFSGLWR